MRTPFQQAVSDFLDDYPQYVNYLAEIFKATPSQVVNWTYDETPCPTKQALILAQIEEIRRSVN